MVMTINNNSAAFPDVELTLSLGYQEDTMSTVEKFIIKSIINYTEFLEL